MTVETITPSPFVEFSPIYSKPGAIGSVDQTTPIQTPVPRGLADVKIGRAHV